MHGDSALRSIADSFEFVLQASTAKARRGREVPRLSSRIRRRSPTRAAGRR
jgi:hypothetical protein